MFVRHAIGTGALVGLLLASGVALARGPEEMVVRIGQVKISVDGIIGKVSGKAHSTLPDGQGPFYPGGGTGTGSGDWVVEKDDTALAILLDASYSLLWSANYADLWKQAVRSGDMTRANHYFVIACDKTAISRSQIARANTAAAEQPVGLLAAFGTELQAHVEELQKLRTDNGCP